MKKIILTLISFFTFLGTANAALLTFQYSGVVTDTYYSDKNGFDPNIAHIDGYDVLRGYAVGGTLFYDSSNSLWLTHRLGFNAYLGTGSISVEISRNGFLFQSSSADNPQFLVGNNSRLYNGADFFTFSSFTAFDVPELYATFFLVDSTGSVFSSAALPTELDLSRFSQRTLTQYFQRGEIESQFTANITSLKLINAVPEPSSALLLLLGFGFLIYSTKLLPRS